MIWRQCSMAIAISLGVTLLPWVGFACFPTRISEQASSVEQTDERSVQTNISPEQQQALLSCLKRGSNARILPLNFPQAKTALGNNAPPQRYFVGYFTNLQSNPYRLQGIKGFIPLTLKGSRCQVLNLSAARDVAKALIMARYKDQFALADSDWQIVRGDIVNRWERDHYVSGPGNHPLVLDIEDIWTFITLGLSLPDYLPIEIRQDTPQQN